MNDFTVLLSLLLLDFCWDLCCRNVFIKQSHQSNMINLLEVFPNKGAPLKFFRSCFAVFWTWIWPKLPRRGRGPLNHPTVGTAIICLLLGNYSIVKKRLSVPFFLSIKNSHILQKIGKILHKNSSELQVFQFDPMSFHGSFYFLL